MCSSQQQHAVQHIIYRAHACHCTAYTSNHFFALRMCMPAGAGHDAQKAGREAT